VRWILTRSTWHLQDKFVILMSGVWHNGQFIGEVTGADGPGVQIISKHPLMSSYDDEMPEVVEVRIATPEWVAANN
jgi:hypothetical protein